MFDKTNIGINQNKAVAVPATYYFLIGFVFSACCFAIVE